MRTIQRALERTQFLSLYSRDFHLAGQAEAPGMKQSEISPKKYNMQPGLRISGLEAMYVNSQQAKHMKLPTARQTETVSLLLICYTYFQFWRLLSK